MKVGPLKGKRFRWALLVLATSSWMSMGLLSDCDPEIAGPVITGVGSAAADIAAVLVEAGFAALVPETPTPVTTGG
ncbi:MAG TPA: hypothetical protein PL151_04865 [Phycisphaerae bacterium]|nr:hypothetical protein [Phycisphaerae bacterium]HOJ75702.1 hypothetical protein [Phycisphaerae bacterium]HOM53157.1 hypothetical protein [Phycisphaerae bacterium]HON67078.1 hypothetical protein [Phycisphaerae bacterium]HOQ87495.1 hypothetical protein [Phycisphaerae bacterium]